MLRAAIVTVAISLGTLSFAKADCDHFKWSVARELSLFNDAPEPVETGADASLDRGYALELKPTPNAGFVLPLERAAKSNAFGGVLKVAVELAGAYEVTLSGEAWIDAIQGGARVKSDNFSAQKDCAGVRKSVRFNLAAGSTILQISNSEIPAINLAIVPAP